MLLIPPYHFVCEFRCSFSSTSAKHVSTRERILPKDVTMPSFRIYFSIFPYVFLLDVHVFGFCFISYFARGVSQTCTVVEVKKSFCCHVFHISRRCGIFYLQSMVIFNTAEDLTSIPHDGYDGSTGARTLGQITPDPRCEEHLPCPRIDPKVYFTLFHHNILGYMINKHLDRSRYILSSGEDKPKGFTVVILFLKIPCFPSRPDKWTWCAMSEWRWGQFQSSDHGYTDEWPYLLGSYPNLNIHIYCIII